MIPRYGLAAGVWTNDMRRVFRMTRALKVGTIWVNAYRTLNATMPVRRDQAERLWP